MTIPSAGAHDPASTSQGSITCSSCGLSGGPFGADEAEYLAGLHNHLHHGGAAPSLAQD